MFAMFLLLISISDKNSYHQGDTLIIQLSTAVSDCSDWIEFDSDCTGIKTMMYGWGQGCSFEISFFRIWLPAELSTKVGTVVSHSRETKSDRRREGETRCCRRLLFSQTRYAIRKLMTRPDQPK